jgi:hypothetical protein
MSVWCGLTWTVGIQIFDRNGVSLLDIGKKGGDKFDIDLNESERIVGI